MQDDMVLYEKVDNIAIITFNRPRVFNALSREVNLKLIELLTLAENDDEVRVVILTGAGEKAFVAGGDVKEMAGMDAMGGRGYALQAKRSVDKLNSLKKPIIAAINGLCLGGGLEYALACDFRVASENAKFALPEINLGIMPGSGGTQRLARLIGMGRAKEMIFSGNMIDAKRAYELGIINHIFEAKTLREQTIAIASGIASKSPVAISLIKTAMDKGMEMTIESGFALEMSCFGLCFSTDEAKQAMDKFLNKPKS